MRFKILIGMLIRMPNSCHRSLFKRCIWKEIWTETILDSYCRCDLHLEQRVSSSRNRALQFQQKIHEIHMYEHDMSTYEIYMKWIYMKWLCTVTDVYLGDCTCLCVCVLERVGAEARVGHATSCHVALALDNVEVLQCPIWDAYGQ